MLRRRGRGEEEVLVAGMYCHKMKAEEEVRAR